MFGWSKTKAARLAAVEEESTETRRLVVALDAELDDLRNRVKALTMKVGKLQAGETHAELDGVAPVNGATGTLDPVSARILARRARRAAAGPSNGQGEGEPQ